MNWTVFWNCDKVNVNEGDKYRGGYMNEYGIITNCRITETQDYWRSRALYKSANILDTAQDSDTITMDN